MIIASSGNRTRAARVAGEHSTTEPTMLSYFCGETSIFQFIDQAKEKKVHPEILWSKCIQQILGYLD